MASFDDFESILKEVVQAKRLSASKMGKLTEIALKSMQKDTQLVSILYRTHKSLPAAAKVNSLYVFDALARAARHQVNKQGLTGDINSEKGNCATFLLKVEGVLEGLFQDMITVGGPESKEKTKKILDIWAKGNTFPSAVLSRLTEVVKEAEKEPEVIPVTADPRQSSTTTTTPPVPAPLAANPQSALLALLTQAANAVATPNGQTTSNSGPFAPTPQLDTAQLALLQQLAQTAKLNGVPSQPIPAPVPVPTAPPPFQSPRGGPSRSPTSYRDEPRGGPPGRRDMRGDRYFSPERRGYDDRPNPRGGFRGGFRGRGGRGDHDGGGRSRWDEDYDRDRDRFRDSSRDRDWSPRRARRSRSRSPPSRYGGTGAAAAGRRDIKPYSPPRRPSIAPLPLTITAREQTHSAESIPLAGATREVEKDEFGRDIRPESPMNISDAAASDDISTTQPQPQPPSPPPVPSISSVEPTVSAQTRTHDQISLSSPSVLAAANTSPQPGSAGAAVVSPNAISSSPPSDVNSQQQQQAGMDQFNLATFDFTSPASWEALGKMWQITYGYLPSTEQLMQFVMSGGIRPEVVASHQQLPTPQVWSAEQNNWMPGSNVQMQTQMQWRGGGRGVGVGGGGITRGFGPGRGSYGHVHGNTRDAHGQEQWNSNYGDTGQHGTEAVGLGAAGTTAIASTKVTPAENTGTGGSTGGGLGGRMQRVGDRWVFVKDPVAPAVS